MKLTESNYYTAEADWSYWSVSQYKNFMKCEAAALAKLRSEYEEPMTKAMLVGSWVDSYFDGSLSEFKKRHKIASERTGELYAEYRKANEIISRIKADPLFMRFMSGEKQKILTFEMFGLPWKIKMDSFVKGVCITDLKTMMNFRNVPLFRYDLQGAVYQAGCEANGYGVLPFYLAIATKEKVIDLDIFQIRQESLDLALREIEGNIQHYNDVKQGFEPPTYCGHCNYCKIIKRARVRDYNELLEG